MTGGITPAGSSRVMRLDPLHLPVRVAAADPTADGNTRIAEIDRERVLVLRSVRGVRMRLNLPLAHFLGVSMRACGRAAAEGRLALVLEHRDALSVPLQYAAEAEDLVADLACLGARARPAALDRRPTACRNRIRLHQRRSPLAPARRADADARR